MGLALAVLVGGLQSLDLATFSATSTYFVNPDSMQGFGEPEVDAEYADSAGRHGSGLSNRRFRNRVVRFSLVIRATTGTDAREAARNAIANVLDKARRYQTGETLGTTAAEGEVVLKYCPPNGTQPVYARVVDGALGSGDGYSSAAAMGSAAGNAFDPDVPVTFVLEPFWRPERDFYLRNVLLNGGFESVPAGTPTTPYGWTATTTSGTITADYGGHDSFVRSGLKSFFHHISASTTAGTIRTDQTVTLADVGLAAGQTILVSVWVYIYSRTGTGSVEMTVNDGDAHTTTTSTTGQWVRLTRIIDLASAATSFTLTLLTRAGNVGDTILAFWDEAQVQPHADNLLNGGGITHDANADGIADFWTYGLAGTASVTPTLDATAKYDTNSQQIVINSSSTSGTIDLSQSVTLNSASAPKHNIRAGDVLTFGAWLDLVALTGTVTVKVRLDFLDANGRTLSSAADASPTTAAGGGWVWHKATGEVPFGASTVKSFILIEFGSGATATVRADWMTLYRGHSDQASRRFWPWTDRAEALLPIWTDSSRLTNEPGSTDGRWALLAHTNFPGNVPGPCQLVIGCGREMPDPLILGYRRGATTLGSYVNVISGTNISGEMGADATDADAIQTNYRLWTPATTNETLLINFSGADTPPGRYLIVLRAKLTDQTHYDRYSFRAAVRLNNANTAAGSWSLILHGAAPWINTSGTPGYELWPIGVIPLPLRSRLPTYINASRFEIWGRVSNATGTSIRIDGCFFVPLDAYYEGQPSAYVVPPAANTTEDRYTALVDSITPLPGGLLAHTDGTYPRRLPTTFDDQPDAREEPFYLGDKGQISVLHSGASHVKTYRTTVGVLYRPWFSTAGVIS